jgi:YHS domain-containing protein
MRIVLWVLRILALLLLVRVVLRMLFPRRGAQGAPGGPAKPAGKIGGELVRDPHCGTYVAKTSALSSLVKGEMVYFCSAACRDSYLAGARS